MDRVVEEDIKNIASEIAPVANKLNGKTLLITGGAGFLGNYIILTIDYLNKHFLKNPCKIISVDNFITGVRYQLPEGPTFKVIQHDIKLPLKVEDDVNFVIHAAGLGSPKFYRIYKIETIDVGVIGTKNMLEFAREKNAESFMFFSSSEIYGNPDPKFVPTPETYWGNVLCTGPRANYDESKRLGETLCITYNEVYNIPVKIVRPFNVYGPGMRKDDARVIPNFVSNALRGNPLPVNDEGNCTRTFCYITDAVAGFFKVLLSDYNKEPFNVGYDQQEVSIADLANIMAKIFDNKVEITKGVGINDAYGVAEPKRRCPDLTKIRTKLGYNPKINLETGLRRFIQWAAEDYGVENQTIANLVKNMPR